MLYAILHRKGLFRLTGQVAGRIARIILAAAAMAAALYYAIPLAGDAFIGGVFERIAALGALVPTGAIIFFGCAVLFGVVNRDAVGQLRRRKLSIQPGLSTCGRYRPASPPEICTSAIIWARSATGCACRTRWRATSSISAPICTRSRCRTSPPSSPPTRAR